MDGATLTGKGLADGGRQAERSLGVKERLAALQATAGGRRGPPPPPPGDRSDSTSVIHAGYLYVEPQLPSSRADVTRPRHWQRRWFVLYDNGLLTYAIDSQPDTIPQDTIDLSKCYEAFIADALTKRPNSMRVLLRSDTGEGYDMVTVRSDTERELKRWLTAIKVFCEQQVPTDRMDSLRSDIPVRRKGSPVQEAVTPSVAVGKLDQSGALARADDKTMTTDEEDCLVSRVRRRGWLYYHGTVASEMDDGERLKLWVVLDGVHLKFYKDRNRPAEQLISLDLNMCDQVVPTNLPESYGIQLLFKGVVHKLSAATPGIRDGWLEVLLPFCKDNSSRRVAYIVPRAQNAEDDDRADESASNASDDVASNVSSSSTDALSSINLCSVDGEEEDVDKTDGKKGVGRSYGALIPKSGEFRSRSSSPPVCLSPVSRLKEKSNSRRQAKGSSASLPRPVALDISVAKMQQSTGEMAVASTKAKASFEDDVATNGVVDELRKKLEDSACELAETRRVLLRSLKGLEADVVDQGALTKRQQTPRGGGYSLAKSRSMLDVSSEEDQSSACWVMLKACKDQLCLLEVFMGKLGAEDLLKHAHRLLGRMVTVREDSEEFVRLACQFRKAVQNLLTRCMIGADQAPLPSNGRRHSSLLVDQTYAVLKRLQAAGCPSIRQLDHSAAPAQLCEEAIGIFGNVIAMQGLLGQAAEAGFSNSPSMSMVHLLDNMRDVFLFYGHMERLLAEHQEGASLATMFDCDWFKLLCDQLTQPAVDLWQSLIGRLPDKARLLTTTGPSDAIYLRMVRSSSAVLPLAVYESAARGEQISPDAVASLCDAVSNRVEHWLSEAGLPGIQERLIHGMLHLACRRKAVLDRLDGRLVVSATARKNGLEEKGVVTLASACTEDYVAKSVGAFKTMPSLSSLRAFVLSLHGGLAEALHRLLPRVDMSMFDSAEMLCYDSCRLSVSNLLLPATERLVTDLTSEYMLRLLTVAVVGSAGGDGSCDWADATGDDAALNTKCRELEASLKQKEEECERLLAQLNAERADKENVEKLKASLERAQSIRESQFSSTIRGLCAHYENRLQEDKETTRLGLKMIKRRYEQELKKRLASAPGESADEPEASGSATLCDLIRRIDELSQVSSEKCAENVKLRKKVQQLEELLLKTGFRSSPNAKDTDEYNSRQSDQGIGLSGLVPSISTGGSVNQLFHEHYDQNGSDGMLGDGRRILSSASRRSLSTSSLVHADSGALTDSTADHHSHVTNSPLADRRRTFERRFIS